MKVICINDHTFNGRKVKLTPGKIYEARLNYEDITEFWVIRNDIGVFRWYEKDVLMPLDDFRNMKLKELGI